MMAHALMWLNTWTAVTAFISPQGHRAHLATPRNVRTQLCAADDWREGASQSLDSRDFTKVDAAILAAVRGDAALPGDEPTAVLSPSRSRQVIGSGRVTWSAKVAYHGVAFSGFAWQRSARLPTVEESLQTAIRTLTDGSSEVRVQCAGRTDAGVSAVGQLVSFHASADLKPRDISRAIAHGAPRPGSLRVVHVRTAADSYHATFSTAWRRYAYFLPVSQADPADEAKRLDDLLRSLEGTAHDFSALGRGVPEGKNTTTLLRHASARLVDLPPRDALGGGAAIRIDVVGDRFLRQQVRTLVATAVALAQQQQQQQQQQHADWRDDRRLLDACTSGRPEETAHPAPAEGLVFVAAGSLDELDPAWLSEDEAALLDGHDEALDGYGLEPGSDALGDAAPAPAPSGSEHTADAAAFATALLLLEQQEATGAPLDGLLSRHARAQDLSQPQRAAIGAHLDAVARCHGRLDARLSASSVGATPRARLLASVRLCAGFRPVHEVVADLSAAEEAWLATLAPPLETPCMPPAARLECPAWAWPRFVSSFGEAGAVEELRALQDAAPLDLRVNTLKTTRDAACAALRAAGFDAVPTPYSPVGLRLARRRVALGTLPGLLDGHVEPQDEGSQLVALLLDARPGDAVVDYCAGSGGKTLALAAAMCNKGKVLAMDLDSRRLARCAPRLAKAGVDNVERHVIDAGPSDKWLKRRKRSFDRVLVDAPCTGVGAWRRNPDARWARHTRSLTELLPVQQDVLQRAARLVRPGGVLVYATCSTLHDENDAQVEAFLASEDGAEFELAPPSGFCAPLDGPFLRLTPSRHGCDGFFGAVLTRREGGWSGRARRGRRRR